MASMEEEVAKAVAAGKGWSQEERKSYLDKVSDNHPMFAERIEVSIQRMVLLRMHMIWESCTH